MFGRCLIRARLRASSEGKEDSMAGKTFDADFEAPQQVVYSSAVEVVARLGYNTLEARPEVGILTFNTGRSMKSWAGQDMTATIIDMGDGKSQLILGGTLARQGAQTQLGAWGEKKSIATKFIDQLRETVARRAQAM